MDIEKLREELKDNYGTAMAAGFGVTAMDVAKVERASDEEIVQMAKREGLIRR